MRVILDKNEYKFIWNKVYSKYRFDGSQDEWLSLPFVNKKYTLSKIWTEEQEKMINGIFSKLCFKELYALDWQHDCFVFSPDEDIPLNYCFFDKYRSCNVYFPSYYPDGDYYFFITTDWDSGLFGHPWRKEIFVMGDKLIEEFNKIKDILLI